MNSKIIFFDIDGTILSHRTGLISESTRSAIRQAREKGHLTFINTGRTLAEMDAVITNVGFDGLVCGCGTYITCHDSVLMHKTVASDVTQSIVADLKKYQIDAILEGTNAVYYNTVIRYDRLRAQRGSHRDIYHFNVQTWDSSDIVMDKFCIWPENDAISELFYNKYKEYFDFIDREGRLYEVVPKGYSKATGIEFLLSHLGLSWDNTYALGDGANDLQMLSYVKHSIAMGNADPEIQNIVSYTTGDVDEDGVAAALAHYNLI